MINAVKNLLDFEAYHFKLIYCKIRTRWRPSCMDDALDTVVQAIPILNFLDRVLLFVKLRKWIREL